MMRAIDIIKVGTDLQVRFIDSDDAIKWYTGKVTRVGDYDEDDDGEFVECEIAYEDGEVGEEFLYECHFEDEDNLNAWRFKSDMSKLIKQVITNTRQLEEINEKLDYIVERLDADDSDDDEDYTDELDDDDPPPKKKHHQQTCVWYMLKMFTLLTVILAVYTKYQVRHRELCQLNQSYLQQHHPLLELIMRVVYGRC